MELKISNILVDKVKEKKDGIYSYKNYLYVIKDEKFIVFCN